MDTENWENFCGQKFSQTLSKNFDWGTRRERRMPQILIEKQPLNLYCKESAQ